MEILCLPHHISNYCLVSLVRESTNLAETNENLPYRKELRSPTRKKSSRYAPRVLYPLLQLIRGRGARPFRS